MPRPIERHRPLRAATEVKGYVRPDPLVPGIVVDSGPESWQGAEVGKTDLLTVVGHCDETGYIAPRVYQ